MRIFLIFFVAAWTTLQWKNPMYGLAAGALLSSVPITPFYSVAAVSGVLLASLLRHRINSQREAAFVSLVYLLIGQVCQSDDQILLLGFGVCGVIKLFGL